MVTEMATTMNGMIADPTGRVVATLAGLRGAQKVQMNLPDDAFDLRLLETEAATVVAEDLRTMTVDLGTQRATIARTVRPRLG